MVYFIRDKKAYSQPLSGGNEKELFSSSYISSSQNKGFADIVGDYLYLGNSYTDVSDGRLMLRKKYIVDPGNSCRVIRRLPDKRYNLKSNKLETLCEMVVFDSSSKAAEFIEKTDHTTDSKRYYEWKFADDIIFYE